MKRTITFVRETPVTRKDGTPVQGRSPQGTEWKLYAIWDEKNIKYSVFGSLLDEAEAKIGDTLEITYIAEKQGGFVNNKITNLHRVVSGEKQADPPINNASEAEIEQIMLELGKINDKLDRILANQIKKPGEESLPF